MTISILQVTAKCALVRYVSSSTWVEIATWLTSKSSLKGWQFQNTAKGRGRGWGRRLITPVLGFAVWVSREGR